MSDPEKAKNKSDIVNLESAVRGGLLDFAKATVYFVDREGKLRRSNLLAFLGMSTVYGLILLTIIAMMSNQGFIKDWIARNQAEEKLAVALADNSRAKTQSVKHLARKWSLTSC